MDVALWDIKAKLLCVPLHELLGGLTRDRLWVYAQVAGNSPEELIAEEVAIRTGFRAVKAAISAAAPSVHTAGYVEKEVERFSRFREAVWEISISRSTSTGALAPSLARVLLEELVPVRPLFCDEVWLPEDVEAMRGLREGTAIRSQRGNGC